MSHDVFELVLPPLAEHLGTARSFAAAVARHYDVAGETIEDLKIAISEACIDALVASTPIRVRAEDRGRSIAFSIEAPEGDDAPERLPLDELGAPARVELIRSLFGDATVDAGNGTRAIRFTLDLD
jgi:hypothetical protein